MKKELKLDVTKLRELTSTAAAGVAGGTDYTFTGHCSGTCNLSYGDPIP